MNKHKQTAGDHVELGILKRADLAVRKKRPFLPDDRICDIYCGGDLLEISFLSRCCSRDRQGSCMMCDYGAARDTHPVKAYLAEMDRILEYADPSINILLLCTNGSFFDDSQIGPELFCAILERAGRCRIPVIEIETHYQDVTPKKLELLKRAFPEKEVVIELGLETVQPKYQEKVIMKGIELAAYERVITLIRNFGFRIDINIMVGLPLLSPREQFEDALRTVHWSFAHGGRPVLFPINIKPYTLLMEAYRAGIYAPVSQWMLLLLLDALPEDQLEQVTVAWYGDREEIYDGGSERAVFPTACPVCSAAIRTFYETLPAIPSGARRKKQLRRLLAESGCQCQERTRREISQVPANTFEDRYAAFLSWLVQQNF